VLAEGVVVHLWCHDVDNEVVDAKGQPAVLSGTIQNIQKNYIVFILVIRTHPDKQASFASLVVVCRCIDDASSRRGGLQ
jgi:hypothetical protein